MVSLHPSKLNSCRGRFLMKRKTSLRVAPKDWRIFLKKTGLNLLETNKDKFDDRFFQQINKETTVTIFVSCSYISHFNYVIF